FLLHQLDQMNVCIGAEPGDQPHLAVAGDVVDPEGQPIDRRQFPEPPSDLENLLPRVPQEAFELESYGWHLGWMDERGDGFSGLASKPARGMLGECEQSEARVKALLPDVLREDRLGGFVEMEPLRHVRGVVNGTDPGLTVRHDASLL